MKEGSALIDQLVQVAPELEEAYHEHMQKYGELLAHVLMGEFTRWFIRSCRSIAANSERTDLVAERDAFIRVLDTGLIQGDEATQEVILASFLENLHQAGNDYGLVRAALTEGLRERLKLME